MVTVFDIHETLVDIMEDRIRIIEDTLEADIFSERGISLFRDIPTERTCKRAGINALYCVCERYGIPIAPSGNFARLAAKSVVAYLNNELEEKTTACSVLRLSNILEAEIIDPEDDEEADGASVVKVKIEVLPSFGILESIVWFRVGEKRDVSYELKSGVNRLNMYGEQSWCVVDPILKKFCYCIEQPDYGNSHAEFFPGM